MHVVDLATSGVVDIDWDRDRLPYLTHVGWDRHGLLVAVQSRDQRNVEVFDADPVTASALRACSPTPTPPGWSWCGGVPRWWAPGGAEVPALVVCADRDGARRLLVDGEPVTPPSLQVRSVAAADDGGIVFCANPLDDATVLHVWRYTPGGELQALTDEPGVHAVAAAGADRRHPHGHGRPSRARTGTRSTASS